MQIGVDISAIIYGTGVSVYTKNLVENLLLLDTENEYLLFGGSLRRSHELKEFIAGLKGNISRSRVLSVPPTLANIVWNKMHIFPIEMFMGNMDVFHSSDWTQPPSSVFKVTTIHDLSPILFPGESHPKIVKAHGLRLKWVVKEVDRVIVPSETTAKDAIKIGIDKNKIRIIPEAVDGVFTHVSRTEVESVKLKYKISGKYLLAVGVNPRKNTKRIIEAFNKIKSNINAGLVIIGHPYIKTKDSEDIIFTGHVSQAELPAFYSGAEALVYPSLYEGFGLPILEAFACKIPVVTSNLGSMAEIGKGAAVLVNPNEVESIARGIEQALVKEKSLVEAGSRLAKAYSWEETARQTLKVYNEAKI